MAPGNSIDVDGYQISVTNLTKVLYPEAGTRKYDVIDYYTRIAEVMLPHIVDRLVTRKRWPNGVESQPFFEKDLPAAAPNFLRRFAIEHSQRLIHYPIVDKRADLVWLAQQAALELHVPQWRTSAASGPNVTGAGSAASGPNVTGAGSAASGPNVTGAGSAASGPNVTGAGSAASGPNVTGAGSAASGPNVTGAGSAASGPIVTGADKKDPSFKATRLVLDLDPGPDVALYQCAQVAIEINQLLSAAGLTAFPVTSGGKGIHVYAPFDDPVSPDAARAVAKQIATSLAAAHPDEVTASMSKAVRDRRVFIDWSQNSGSKTTLAPYSLRGREQPWVAAPRTWAELAEPDLRQLIYTEVLERVEHDGDLLAGLDAPLTAPPARAEAPSSVVSLGEYRRKRNPSLTPEPFSDDAHRARAVEDDESTDDTGQPGGPIFVIQEHHARRLHYDFRLERDGVLVSWAIPKNLPVTSDQNRLAVQTEDHPMDYANFAGDIPAGEYGGGHVEIWDRGTYETEKWRDKEIIVRLHGDRIQGRYVLIRTGEKNWLAHLMSDEPRPILPDSLRDPRPMLATDEPIDNLTESEWAFEGKWDGYRIILRYLNGNLRLTSRSGLDMTADFPELQSLADELGMLEVVLDGEVVAIDPSGRTNFTLLASRRNTTEPYELRFYVFDVLFLNGTSLLKTPWRERRQVLDELAPLFRHSPYAQVPPLLPGPGKAAAQYSRDHNLEGVVAKRRDSIYQQGRRSTRWLKHKNWSDIEVVIGGWRPGQGNRANTIGSLLLGLPEETGLRYVGRVGTGFTDASLAALVEELEPLRIRRSPFLDNIDRPVAASAIWVLPKIVGEVQFMDWTSTGHLRHPSWRGIRRDKLPGDL
ncbi:non-homologous end-joining DNA ligase [Gordonia sp. CPCC 205333]|uniref:non-homologous end-joining DNA ligase n=1 Tax=Gordonia sp. CPCC 205333 TaxID=3140790 RepID=UPI003AF36700